jgi:hypothetical protein
LELFYDFNGFQLLFSALFRILGWVWGAVWGIYAVSATFFLLFFGFLAGFRVLFCRFQRFQLLFLLFSGFWAGFGGAVLGISAVSAPQDPLAMLSTYGYCTL